MTVASTPLVSQAERADLSGHIFLTASIIALFLCSIYLLPLVR